MPSLSIAPSSHMLLSMYVCILENIHKQTFVRMTNEKTNYICTTFIYLFRHYERTLAPSLDAMCETTPHQNAFFLGPDQTAWEDNRRHLVSQMELLAHVCKVKQGEWLYLLALFDNVADIFLFGSCNSIILYILFLLGYWCFYALWKSVRRWSITED